ncbi:hypothetical protein V1282_003559 [Nitrobacteraceae bacterium AZCC 2146]
MGDTNLKPRGTVDDTSNGHGLSRVTEEIVLLTEDGVLGFYTHFEVTEIVAFRGKGAAPRNVFTILVAEDRKQPADSKPDFLMPRIGLQGARDWKFGVCRYLRPIADVVADLGEYRATRQWKPSGNPLEVGRLIGMSTQFVPADTTVIAPWNSVLKNNFWNGSHVVELADPDKTELKLFFDDPPLLQELSERIQAHTPIKLASFSDRLGNIVFQIPVTVLTATFAHQRSSGDVVVSVGWNPRATARRLRAVCDMQFDDVLSGYASVDVVDDSTIIPTSSDLGTMRGALWDDDRMLLLAATGSTGFVRTISINAHISDPEPRIFRIMRGSEVRPVSIGIHETNEIRVEAPGQDRGDEWAKKRIYRDEQARLSRERKFVQYRPTGSKAAAHRAALEDIHFLLRRYGKDGAWLWDPYLSATDILETFFFCPHSGVELRALTGAEQAPGEDGETAGGSTHREAFAARQRETFEAAASNWRGLRLEYRMRCGSAGWPFHDRFLIFPVKDGGAHAWSLGTSVNSFGTIHHILQKVDDGQLVMDAFAELWGQLDQPQHLILKRP